MLSVLLATGQVMAQVPPPPRKVVATSWVLTLDRPKAGSSVVKGKASDSRWQVMLKLMNPAGGKPIEQRQVAVDKDDLSFVGGFKTVLKAEDQVIAFGMVNGTEVFAGAVVVEGVPVMADNKATTPPPTLAEGVVVPAKTTVAAAGTAPVTPDPVTPSAAAKKVADSCDPDPARAPIQIDGAISGSKKLTVSSSQKGAKVSVCVDGRAVKVLTGTPAAEAGSLIITDFGGDITLPAALQTNHLVTVVVVKDDVRLATDKTVKAGIPAAVSPVIKSDLVPGAEIIRVDATPTIAAQGYEVRLSSCGTDNAPLKSADGKTTWIVTDADGHGEMRLDKPLFTGQQVNICQEILDKSDPAMPVKRDLAEANRATGQTAVVDPLNLGMARFYFTSGIVMSQDKGFQTSNSNAGLFLGLDVDRTWLPLNRKGFRRVNFNTYFDGRLTSVATQSTDNTLQSFTRSAKAASLQAGMYLPVVVNRWDHKRYSLFFAPVAKAGFVTLVDDARGATTPNGTTTVTTGATGATGATGGTGTTMTTTINAGTTTAITDRFYTFWATGVRLGLFAHSGSKDVAPDLVSYVDITRGKFGSFEAYRKLTSAEAGHPDFATPISEFYRVRPYRWSFEGLLKIPKSPFVLGFNANIGSGATAAQTVNSSKAGGASFSVPFTQPRDDLRFLFGARFDFAKLLAALPRL